MIAEKDLLLPLELLNTVYESLSNARGPGDLVETYPLLLDILDKAITYIERRVKDGEKP